MMVGCYTLDLYCDRDSLRHKYGEFPHQYTGKTESSCRRQARLDGWRLNLRTGTDICPACVIDLGQRITE